MLRIVPGAKFFVNSPLYHAGPYAWTMLAAAAGSAVVLRQKFDAAKTLDDLQKNAVEQAYFVPLAYYAVPYYYSKSITGVPASVTQQRPAAPLFTEWGHK